MNFTFSNRFAVEDARYRQRKSFRAIAKQITSQKEMIPTCGAICAKFEPCSMFARNASMTAVNGSALMIGCIISGNFCEEKNTPEAIHIGIITIFIRPEAASMVLAH